MIVAGASAYPRVIDWARFREIADEVGALFMADMAHIAGLVRGRRPPQPGAVRRHRDHHDPQVAAWPARRPDPLQGEACPGDRPGGLPDAPGRPDPGCGCGARGLLPRGDAAVLPDLQRAGGQERGGAGRRDVGSGAEPGLGRHGQPSAGAEPAGPLVHGREAGRGAGERSASSPASRRCPARRARRARPAASVSGRRPSPRAAPPRSRCARWRGPWPGWPPIRTTRPPGRDPRRDARASQTPSRRSEEADGRR